MKKNHFRSIFLAAIFLVLVSLACRFGQRDQVTLGDSLYNEEGGYSLNTVKDYKNLVSGQTTEMTATDAVQGAGPTIIVKGGLLDYVITNDALLERIRGEYDSLEFNRAKEITIDGVDGLASELSGELMGIEIKGSVFLASVEPNQEFIMMAFAPESRWKELSPLFTNVLNSVSFFEPSPLMAESDAQEPPTEEFTPEATEEAITEPVADVTEAEIIRQWAVYAEASTEYTEDDWSAIQATGAPDVDRCGDDSRAWASRYSNTEDFLLLEYEIPVIPTELVIYQTYNPSQVVEILFEDLDGDVWVLWEGEPERVDCPDIWTHTIELEELFYTDTIVLIIDQSLNDWGWAEIDAVELVGYQMGAEVAQGESQPEPDTPVQPGEEAQTIDEDIPGNYEGLMAGSVYQGWISIVIGETMEADLDRIMTIEGRESTDSWKPRESHAMTYRYQMPWDDMTGFISVTTEGWVYKMNVSPNVHPDDFALATVNRANYEALKAIYDRDKLIPYPVMANLLESPGFLREKYVGDDDGKIRTTYNWYNTNGDRITGLFVDGNLTGIIGLNFIEAD